SRMGMIAPLDGGTGASGRVPTWTAMRPATCNRDARMREPDFRPDSTALEPPSLFPGFFLAGFECATPINRHGKRVDPVAATEHDRRVWEDYQALLRVGIRGVREGARWDQIDRGGRYDFRPLRTFVEAAQELGMTVIWDLFHYGYPDGEDPFS